MIPHRLFINNEWRDASGGQDDRGRQSGDRGGHRDRRLGRAGRRRRGRRGGARGVRRAVGQAVGARARPAGLEARRAADGARRRDRAARDAAQRQADLRVAADRDSGGRRMLPVLRRLGRQDSRRDDPGQGQLPHLHAARAGRRRRGDRAVEFSAAADGVEGRAGARLRQHGHHQAGEPDAADGARARRDRASRSACRPACSTSITGPGSTRRAGDRRASRASTRSRSPATRRPARGSCAARPTR